MGKSIFQEVPHISDRTSWLKMSAAEGKEVTYTSKDGRVALIGDAAHAMTPSLSEGGNTAMDRSAVKLVDCSTRKRKKLVFFLVLLVAKLQWWSRLNDCLVTTSS